MIQELLSSINFRDTANLVKSFCSDSEPRQALVGEGKYQSLRDLNLLYALMPSEDVKEFLKTGRGQHLLTFCLRHQLTKINLCGHYYNERSDELATLLHDEDWQGYQEVFDSWLQDGLIPLIGFNPIGAVLKLQQIGRCRAFDSYDLNHCPNEGAVFCKDHNSERWWSDLEALQFVQSKMYHFYFHVEHCQDFTEADLEQLLKKFWGKFSKWQDLHSHVSVQEALSLMDIGNIQDLKAMGAKKLQRLFHKKALVLHPDKGGRAEDCVQLKASYEILRSEV